VTSHAMVMSYREGAGCGCVEEVLSADLTPRFLGLISVLPALVQTCLGPALRW
jgi:hypothetical protein